jgi:TetR/AcrR family transcriptional regulator
MDDSKVTTILEAARKRFAYYGLSKTTMNEIAADIGMSKAALYYYFPDKERIFIAVVQQEIEEFASAIERLIDTTSKASFKLRKFVAQRNQLLQRLENLGKIENPRPEDYFNPIFADLRAAYSEKEKNMVERIFQRGIDEGEFVKFAPAPYAELFLASLSGIRFHALATGKAATVDIGGTENVHHQSRLLADIFLQSVSVKARS